MAQKKFKLANKDYENDHVFVRGRTVFLRDMTEADAEALFKNGDKRVESVRSQVEPARPSEVK
ncbi:MAG: hypothetical protein LCH91_05480 [Bacteroidetes bacterium]|nr:hypothetical protein [Bacteroidota bacterium]